MSSVSKAMLQDATMLRARIAEEWCPVKTRTGSHNNMPVRHWFRHYNICATCGYVLQVAK
jgi:hypothetical protein